MRSVSGIGRIAAVAAVLAAAVVVGVILFGGTANDYVVKARFENAGQLVKGNLVQVGGVKAGTVKKMRITPDGQAEITLKIDDHYMPLRRGTKAIIRQASQSGIANRYVDLQLGPGNADGTIPDGGTIPGEDTESAVDLDQLFNTLDPKTRKSLQDFFKGSAAQYRNAGAEANAGFHYLNPALGTSSRLFNELNKDTPALESFVVDSSQLVTALADRRDALAGLIHNLNATTAAIGSQKQSLASAIEQLPPFMRKANTTFVNLRSTLDQVDPLVEASKPVVKELRPFMAQLRPLARDAKPVITDLDALVRRPGRSNDLVELTRTFGPLHEVALQRKTRNGKERDGAFPEIARATTDSAPIIGFGRPYTVDLFGWFDDFSNTGVYDALGGLLRFQVEFNAFSPNQTIPTPVDPGKTFDQFAKTHQFKRCPGASEAAAADKSNVWSAEEMKALDCREEDRAVDPPDKRAKG